MDDRLIAFCGIRCDACPGRKATVDNDDELRSKTAAEWSAQFGADIKPEDINCVGCTVMDGPHIGHWTECGIKRCAAEREVENCAHCADYACEQLAKFLEMVPPARETLEQLRRELESD